MGDDKRLFKYGCGSHGCVISPPKGLGTNMICKCHNHPRFPAWSVMQIQRLRKEVERLTEMLEGVKQVVESYESDEIRFAHDAIGEIAVLLGEGGE